MFAALPARLKFIDSSTESFNKILEFSFDAKLWFAKSTSR